MHVVVATLVFHPVAVATAQVLAVTPERHTVEEKAIGTTLVQFRSI